jgi:hypothetical protein
MPHELMQNPIQHRPGTGSGNANLLTIPDDRDDDHDDDDDFSKPKSGFLQTFLCVPFHSFAAPGHHILCSMLVCTISNLFPLATSGFRVFLCHTQR